MINQNTLEEKKVRGKIGLILLAAGDSSRLGQPKQLLVHQGKTLLQHSLEVVHASHADPVVVVLGANAATIKNEMKDVTTPIVINTAWEEGMASSIRCGVNAIAEMNPAAEGLILMVCDQPFISASLLNQLIAVHFDTGKPIVTSGYAGTFGPPTLFQKNIFPELLQLRGDVGARSVLNKHPNEVEVIPFPEGKLDIDTIEDFQKLLTGNLGNNDEHL